MFLQKLRIFISMARITLKTPTDYRCFFYLTLMLPWLTGRSFCLIPRLALFRNDIFTPEALYSQSLRTFS